MPLKLVAATGEPSIEVPPGRALLVGRSLSCDLPLRDPTVSRNHAEVRLAQRLDGGEEGGVWVRDLGSTNGTFVDGERVVDSALARPGARVTFGKVELQLELSRLPAPVPEDEASSASALEATILRQVRVRGPADVAAQLADPPEGGHLRIAGRSAEDRSARKLQLLIDIAKELSQQPDIDPLLDKVVGLTFQVLQADRVAILIGESPDELIPRVWKSRAEGAERWHVPRSVARKAGADRVAILVENTESSEGADAPARSALCAPLLGSQGRLLGALYLDEQGGDAAFSGEDLEFLTAFSGMVAVALENSQLVGRVRREAVVLSNFQRYFAPDLAEQIAGQDEEIQLGGSKRRVVVLFSDIRGFTSISEAMSPDEIAHLLTEYFTEMVEIVFEHGGTLDKFMGDALMALWGAPLGRADDADRATRAAIAMQRGLERLNWEWLREGRRTISAGIGIGVGEVFAGNIGSDRRLEYTVIGDAVNTAARLCSEAGPGEILVTEELYRALAEPPPVRPLPPLPLRGKAQPVPVYRVVWGAGSGLTQPIGSEESGRAETGSIAKEETQRWSSPKP